MKLYTYRLPSGDCDRIGVGYRNLENTLYPLEAFGLSFRDMNELICNITSEQLNVLKSPPHGADPLFLKNLVLRAPIPFPMQDVLCLGINYTAHHEESMRYDAAAFGDRPKAIYFSKRVNEANCDNGIIPRYEGLVDCLDYEVELGVILGKDAKNIKKQDAEKYIFGYTIINDVSARDLQTGHKQWYFGKSFDGFTPMGPCIITADEVAFPPALGIRCSVNGELRQDGNTRNLMMSISEILTELSRGITLKAGTIIATGTPAGVGMGFDPPRFLKLGDKIICEIEGIGTLTSIVDHA